MVRDGTSMKLSGDGTIVLDRPASDASVGASVPAPATLRILLAQPRGFCAGVVRAIDTVEGALKKFGAPVYVRHEIVHNAHVVADLRAKGALFVEELSEIPDGAVTVFSAHGVARQVVAEAKARALPVLDATCPLVSKVHVQVRRYAGTGREVVLIGHAGHVEVIGTMGQVDAHVHLVAQEADVAALPFPPETPVAYVTQTTLSIDDTRGIIAAMKARFPDIVGPETNDICYATQNRQVAVRALCAEADLLLVVGAANSSNSNRLVEIGAAAGIPSYLVADGDAVDPAWLDGVANVGITAGASAPEALVQHVIAVIRRLRDVEIVHMEGAEEHVEFRIPAALRD